jgi:hypothetical protein
VTTLTVSSEKADDDMAEEGGGVTMRQSLDLEPSQQPEPKCMRVVTSFTIVVLLSI